ncbi:hypothetical protein Misp01_74410 [Microtetraspora sp. NBRC 13810]|nr:hypothetical protein Misp01_74410 [Microtetraspora sp. NBRC 13810]
MAASATSAALAEIPGGTTVAHYTGSGVHYECGNYNCSEERAWGAQW